MRMCAKTFSVLMICLNIGFPQAAETAENRTVIRDVRIWDGRSDDLSAPSSVLIVGNTIAGITRGSENDSDDATIIDGGGRILIPGLIDAHTHISMVRGLTEIRNDFSWMYIGAVAGEEAHRMLLRGFTAVRDIGGPTTGLARAIDEGRLSGPRIYSSGALITQTSGHFDFRNRTETHPNMTGDLNMMERLGWGYFADGTAEVTRAAREVLRTGATQLKVMAGGGVASNLDPIESIQYTPEELRAAVVAAANYGTYVAVHAYTDASIRQALEAGVMSIEHGMLIEEPTMKLMREKGAFLSPQAYIFSVEPKFDWFTDENRRKMRQVSDGLDREMQLAKKHGVKVVFGTDMFGLGYQHLQSLEFGMRLKWFTPVEILRQATSTAAELLALSGVRNPYKEGPLGVIEEGAYADLLIVDGNPLEDITLLEEPDANLVLIMKDGRVYKKSF